MDRSSPLAAIMPPPMWHIEHQKQSSLNLQSAVYTSQKSHTRQQAMTSFLQDTDLSFSPSLDSPATTLAADLSQNFRIAKSPVIPTPRRSLLPSFSFGAKPKVSHTPPLPVSSSPSADCMDVSPLPHKLRNGGSVSSSSSQASFLSSRSSSASSSNTQSSLSRSSSSSLYQPASSIPNRPLVPRLKQLTSSNMLLSPSLNPPSHNLQKFRGNAHTSSASLGDIYFESPIPSQSSVTFGQDTPNSGKAVLPGNFRSISDFQSYADSPLSGVSNRPAHKHDRAKFRRTQSMYQNPGDVIASDIAQETEYAGSIGSISPSPLATSTVPMPSFSVSEDTFKRIEPCTLIDIIDGKFEKYYDRHIIIDCRFEYEYLGGHITGSVNMNSTNQLDDLFLNRQPDEKLLLIFHCEYSAHRAPRMALNLRNKDRHINMHRYPELHFPDIYILHGGYSNFFSGYRSRCEPQNYVEMLNPEHRESGVRQMHKFRKVTKFSRTRSFTLGQSSTHYSSSCNSFLLQSLDTIALAESKDSDTAMDNCEEGL
ncbi:Rhodanese-like domain-containing protein [Dipodascopsis tothii]|uniref:Rhodanese-like domain-containing protein n=1 Tax=Dipodascopsis tothii TaxID=44089 RepID=UPI0034CFC3C2